MQRHLFHHLCYLWNVCLVLKTQESGKVVSGRPKSDVQRIPPSDTSCKQPDRRVARSPHPWMQEAILRWLTLTSWHKVHRYAGRETPSATSSFKALLQAKTIKANWLQMFESARAALKCLAYSDPFPKDILMTSGSAVMNDDGWHLDWAHSGFVPWVCSFEITLRAVIRTSLWNCPWMLN